MRLPFSKVYRAFPELDRFTDEQSAAYVARAYEKRSLAMLIVVLLAVPIACAAGGGVLAVFAAVRNTVSNSAFMTWAQRNGIEELGIIMVLIAVVVSAAVAGLAFRDYWLQWAVRKELIRTTCPGCEYQLLGLPVTGEEVICPECGLSSPLFTLDLRPEELAMPSARR